MTWQALGSQVCELGESPFWHADRDKAHKARQARLYWVDIAGRAALRADPDTGATERWSLPSEPGCMAPAQTAGVDSGWIFALRSGIYRAQVWGGALTCIARLPYDPATQRANDGKCDPQGRFWVGTRDEQGGKAAAMYRINAPSGERKEGSQQSASVHRLWGEAGTLNGLAWSPDQRTLYSSDTPTHCVAERDWNPDTGEPGPARALHQFTPKPPGWASGAAGYGGRPDGAAVDVEGNYWCAMYEGGRVLQLSAAGDVLREIATPLACPTMVCLGGPDLRTLFVTSARHGRPAGELERTPLAGQVLVWQEPVAVPGLPVNAFQEPEPPPQELS